MLRKVHAGALFVCCLLFVQCGTGRDAVDGVLDVVDVPDVATEIRRQVSEVGPETPDICVANCEERECGSNGCGGSCGVCPDYHECLAGQCKAPDCLTGLVPGSLGWPCETNEDCLDQACFVLPDENVCGCNCWDECPEGWECRNVSTWGDLWFVCAPECQPDCDGKECGDDGCGGSCGECPADPCFDACIDGICGASDSGPEICDGLDNNCDGLVDEGFEDADQDGILDCCVSNDGCSEDVDEDKTGAPCFVQNQYGICYGIEKCVGGQAVCEAQTPKPELCDGLDNDCDSDVDEDFADADANCMGDCIELETDSDGILDWEDNCPYLFNPKQEDADMDNTGDVCDPDDDNDLVKDGSDNCPLVYNPDQADGNADGTGDACNSLAGVDSDGDGVFDVKDCAPLDDSVFPGAEEQCDWTDNDCDGTNNEGFPNPKGLYVNFGNCNDLDEDEDCIPDSTDNCPGLPNSGQWDLDSDGLGDQCDPDKDGDGVANEKDCNPENGLVYQDAPEKCDGKDNDCDGEVDENADVTNCQDCDPCTVDICLPDSGGCSHEPVECLDGQACNEWGMCAAPCVPNCDGKNCGPDGCGGSCGQCLLGCPTPTICNAGICVATCAPDCAGKVCGNDGCGCECGECTGEEECVEGECLTICDCLEDGDCAPAENLDLCNGALVCALTTPCKCELDPSTAVECPDGQACVPKTGECCTPSCAGDSGPDGCGGCCRSCDDGNPCTEDTCSDGACKHTGIVDHPFYACCQTDADCPAQCGWTPCAVVQCIDHKCDEKAKGDCCMESSSCVDANPCTTDLCLYGKCYNLGDEQSPEELPDYCCAYDSECDDGNPATTDFCPQDAYCGPPAYNCLHVEEGL